MTATSSPSDAADTRIVYPWQRYWSARTDVLDLSDSGFLADPTWAFSLTPHAKPSTLEELSKFRALVLLGEPGMGKSTTLAAEAARVSQQGISDNFVSIRADLRAYSSDDLLYKRIFESDEFLSWKRGNSHLVLHLDSLDEALLRIDSIANLLASELPQLAVDRMAIRIACRTAAWPSAILEPALIRIWGKSAFGAFELAPLRRRDVVDAAEAQQIDPQKFLSAVFKANAVPFAIKPLTLNMLLDLYKSDGQLPKSVAELYRRGCLTLCEESNASRRVSHRLGALTPAQRLRMAGRLAGVTMLANRYAIWTGPEAPGIPDEDVAISALSAGREEGDFPSFDVGEDHIREVLDTGLFTSRGGARMGWAHQGYAEFLAALYLVDKKVSPGNVLKLLLHPAGGLVPQLAVVAAWTASLSPEVRAALIQAEPIVLLRGDLSTWSEIDVAALTASFLTALEQKRANDFMWDIVNFYPRLSHSHLPSQLRPYIDDPEKHAMSRRAAIMIAEACGLTELQPELLKLAFDRAGDPALRATAVAALRSCGDANVAASMLPFAKGEVGSDPGDEIRGYALQLMWPHHLGAVDLFAILSPPDEGHVGSYVSFLTHVLPDTLSTKDLPVALTWAKSFVESTTHASDFQLKSLADSILLRAWKHLDDPAILTALLDYTQACLAHGGDLFRGTDQDAKQQFLDALKSDPAPRRVFLQALARRSIARTDGYGFLRSSLLEAGDLDWLMSIAPGGDFVDTTLNEETLCNLAETACNLSEAEQFEALYAAAERWPMLWDRYRGVFVGVLLDSADAQQLRKNHDTMQSFCEKKRPLLSPPPAERVAQTLSEFEAGTWRAWWWLNRELTLTPTSTVYMSDLSYAISKMPGWEAADSDTRGRIVKAAERYLAIGKTSVRQWIGSSNAFRNDLAAFRAFILLKEEEPAAYDRITPEIWTKWAPAIAALPQDLGHKVPAAQISVFADALAKAPQQFIAAVVTMIRRERSRVAKSEKAPMPGTSFFRLRDMKACWQNQALCEAVFAELCNDKNSEDQFGVLLDLLLLANYLPARDHAIDLLAKSGLQDREIAVTAASTLAVHCAHDAWPAIWPLISTDPSFGRAFFLKLVLRYHFQESFFSAFSETQLGELYVLLERLFPRTQDPKHQAGKAHFVGPNESVGHLRDGVPRQIIVRGSMEAVRTMRWVVGQLPELDWLSFSLQETEKLMRMKTWAPLLPAEFMRLTASQKRRLVQSAEDLCNILVETLRAYERYLHGEQTPIRQLWDRQAGGQTFRPVEEDALSDNVKLYLQRELAESGVIANREVEIGRAAGASLGKRTDIRLDAVRRSPDNVPLDTITAVIETKGCWNGALFTALKVQLVDDYMSRLAAPVGIYLVGWFDKAKWDTADSRCTATPNISIDTAQRRLDDAAAAIPSEFRVHAVVLDCHAH